MRSVASATVFPPFFCLRFNQLCLSFAAFPRLDFTFLVTHWVLFATFTNVYCHYTILILLHYSPVHSSELSFVRFTYRLSCIRCFVMKDRPCCHLCPRSLYIVRSPSLSRYPAPGIISVIEQMFVTMMLFTILRCPKSRQARCGHVNLRSQEVFRDDAPTASGFLRRAVTHAPAAVAPRHLSHLSLHGRSNTRMSRRLEASAAPADAVDILATYFRHRPKIQHSAAPAQPVLFYKFAA